MVNFNRVKSVIQVNVHPHIPGADSWYWSFKLDQPGEAEAQLLINAMKTNLHQALEKIRRDSYDQGWADAKAKVKKETWFYGGW